MICPMGNLSIDLNELLKDSKETPELTVSVTYFRMRSLDFEQARVSLGYSPGVTLVMPQKEEISFSVNGDLFVIPPETVFLFDGKSEVVFVEREHAIDAPVLHAQLQMLELGATINGCTRLQDLSGLPLYFKNVESKRAADLYHELSNDHQSSPLASRLHDMSIHLAICQIVNLVVRSADKDSVNPKPKQEHEKLKQFLLSNLSKKVTTTDMANYLSMSRSHFYRVGKDLLGEAPATYLRRIRLERGLELLSQTERKG